MKHTTELGALTLPPRRGDSTKGILVPLIGNFCGCPKAPFTPLRIRHCEGSGFSKNLPKWHTTSTLSRGLVLPFWSLVLISLAVTSAVYNPNSAFYNVSLSRTHTTSVLCRWLAGANQRITPPLFYTVNFLQIIFLLLSLSTYIIPHI